MDPTTPPPNLRRQPADKTGRERVDVLINTNHGFYRTSAEADELYRTLVAANPTLDTYRMNERTDPRWVEAFRTLGSKRFSYAASCIHLDGISYAAWYYGFWRIHEYDGREQIVEDYVRAMAKWASESVVKRVGRVQTRMLTDALRRTLAELPPPYSSLSSFVTPLVVAHLRPERFLLDGSSAECRSLSYEDLQAVSDVLEDM